MGKKYKGKICVYCAQATSTSADHVFAREFFLSSERTDLPQVPACDACNRHKALLEHYLTAVLPFGGRHSTAQRNLAELVPKRLARNRKLQQEISAGMRRMWIEKNGRLIPGGALPLDGGRLKELLSLEARGLLWYHWNTLLRVDDVVKVHALTGFGEAFFEHALGMRSASRVTATLADGVIIYEGVQAVDPPQLSVWKIQLYGGMTVGDGASPQTFATFFGVITGPPAIGTLSP